MSEAVTPDRLAELRRIAEAATPGPLTVNRCDDARYAAFVDAPHLGPDAPELAVFLIERDARFFAEFDRDTVLAMLNEIERLRREREVALDILSSEDIGDGVKVEGVRLILKDGDRGWPTRESERARLVGEVGECCRGADPLCAAGCLVEAALRQRLVDKVRGEA